MSGLSGAGVAVADGDPGRLRAAACWHETVAESLDGQAALMDHTAGSVITAWQGEAASSYQALSRAVATRFRTTSDQSRSASMILRRYAHELERYQQEGRHCLAEAEHWHEQVVADRARVAHAEQSARDAQAVVSQARQKLSASITAGPAGAGVQLAATAGLADAQSKLAAAEAAVRDAQRALQDAEDQLRHWQARGRQVWVQALEAGRRASTTLESLSPPPPPPPAGAPAFAPGNSGTESSVGLGAVLRPVVSSRTRASAAPAAVSGRPRAPGS